MATLRVYLGAAPGVGKTYAMLNEGRRRRDRGTDVVVGLVETHGRPRTAEQIGDLEIVPRRTIPYRGATFEEMDVDAILARRPQVALVDELAHTNIPGSRNAHRWEDVRLLLSAGIDVVSTVNIQHLESVNDVIERITGVQQRETIPDEVVRQADQIELVDMTPEALRRRMAHGNIYAPEKMDTALTNYFRAGNLGALRELALLWLADQVDVALETYRSHHGIREPWETRERVVVALSGAPGTGALIRRAARIARRAHGGLLGVHVRSLEGLARPPTTELADQRRLLEELGGEYHETAGSDIAAALIDFARAENATQIVLGASHRSRWREATSGSVVNRVVRLSGPIDVHVISHREELAPRPARQGRRRQSPMAPRRRALAWALTVVGLPALTAGLVQLRDRLGLAAVLLLYLLFVVVDAAIGGVGAALVAALAGFLAVNWYFTPPLHTFTIGSGDNLIALVVALFTATIVGALVAAATRRSAEAARAGAEAQTLAVLAGSVIEPDPLPALLGHLRRAFGLSGACLLRRVADGWQVEAADGATIDDPRSADDRHEVGPDLVLALSGRTLAAADRRLLHAFATQLAAALDRRRMHGEAADAAALSRANALRAALLQAVSHDLRTPLAGIKASVNSLRQPDVSWGPEQTAEFLATVEEETDRLTALIDNLLDMSRIQADAIVPVLRPAGLDEVVPGALASLGREGHDVRVEIPDDLPAVNTDPALLERVVANLVDNALTHGASSEAVRVEAGSIGGQVLLRVIDRGQGIPPGQREAVLAPFQRQGDAKPNRGRGVGLGLAVADGLTRALGGQLSIEDTPGGGTTVVIELAAYQEGDT